MFFFNLPMMWLEGVNGGVFTFLKVSRINNLKTSATLNRS